MRHEQDSAVRRTLREFCGIALITGIGLVGYLIVLLSPALSDRWLRHSFLNWLYPATFHLFVVVFCIGAVIRAGEPVRSLGLHVQSWKRHIFVGVALGFGLLLLQGMGIWAAMRSMPAFEAFYRDNAEVLRNGMPGGALVVVIPLLVLFEEIIFRGYALVRLHTLLGSWKRAALASSVIFGAFHHEQGVPGMLFAAAVGLGYCALVRHARSLMPAVVSHAVMHLGVWTSVTVRYPF